MRGNPLVKEGFELMSQSGFRRIYGLYLVIMIGLFFLAIPAEGPGSGIVYTGPPPVFMRTAAAAAIISLLGLLISISLLTGRIAQADEWFSHTGFTEYATGKALVNFTIAVLYSALLFPFFIMALYFEALPLSGSISAAVYLCGLFLSYSFLMDVLVLLIPGYPVIRQIIIWIIFCFHLLLTARIAPGINPIIQLTRLNNELALTAAGGVNFSIIRTGIFPVFILLPLFLILAFLKAGRRNDDG